VLSLREDAISEGYLEMVNRLLRIALGGIYIAKNTVTFAEPKLFAFLREKIDCAGCGFFCGVELFVIKQHVSEADQTLCLIRRITKPFKDF
jgi:hypothetical protein